MPHLPRCPAAKRSELPVAPGAETDRTAQQAYETVDGLFFRRRMAFEERKPPVAVYGNFSPQMLSNGHPQVCKDFLTDFFSIYL